MGELAPSHYVVAILVTVGICVVVAGLLAIPGIREASSEPAKRRAPIAAALAALVIPVLIGAQATVEYIDRRDDFRSAPDICESDALAQGRIARFIADPPAPEEDTDYDDVSCTWERTADEDRDAAELDVDVTMYDDSGEAARRFQRDNEDQEDDGEIVNSLQLGDDGIRYPYDGIVGSADTLGVAVVVRIDNLMLEVEFDQSESLGTPDPDQLQALAADLVRELESRKPSP